VERVKEQLAIDGQQRVRMTINSLSQHKLGQHTTRMQMKWNDHVTRPEDKERRRKVDGGETMHCRLNLPTYLRGHPLDLQNTDEEMLG